MRSDLTTTGAEFVELVQSGALDLDLPGKGATVQRFSALMALGRRDPVLARLGEGHADALAILAELGEAAAPATVWGVWAAVPRSVRAVPTGDGWRLTGDRPWCSGSAVCTHALVTAEAPDGPRLFRVGVQDPSVTIIDGTWPAIGMARSDSRTVRFTATTAGAVGGPNDYVNRPGFWHGSIGVAACWLGGALGIADALLDRARAGAIDPHATAHLGGVDATISSAVSLLGQAARRIDERPGEQQPLLARRVRAVVESAATEVMDRVGRALGASPLCLDAAHAARVADLTVYLRQSHAERDLEALGTLVAQEGGDVWGSRW